MKKRRIISFIVSMAMLLSSMAALHVTAEDEAAAKQTILPADWHFIDIAHNGDTVVAMAKSATNATGRLYYSADGGNNWQAAENQPLAEAAEISANKVSQQQLVYWDANNIFVAHGAKSTYKSEDGISWTEGDKTADNKMPLHWSTNTMLTVSGPHLVFGGQGAANATSSLTTWEFANNKYTTNASVLSQVVVAQPADADGNVKVLVGGQGYLFDVSFKATSPKYTWEKLENNAGGTVPTAPYDGIYSSKANQYFLIDGTDTMMVANGEKGSKNFKKLSVHDEKIIGIGMNDEYIVVGTDANKLYKTNNVTITEETIWTEIPVMEGMTPADEPIKNIEFLDDGSFVALGTTQIYKGSVEGGYKNINEVVETPTATPTATDAPVVTATPTATPVATPTTAPVATPTTSPTTKPDVTSEPTVTPDVTQTPEEPSEPGIPLPDGWHIIDVAHNDNTIVVMAKNAVKLNDEDDNPVANSENTCVKLYYSNDGGNSWRECETKPLSSGAQISANKLSQQQLVWWENKNLFVVHGGGKTFTSSDGNEWDENANINWTENTYLSVSDEYLILSGGSAMDTAFAAQTSLTAKEYGTTKKALINSPYKTSAVAVKPKDANGDIYAFALGAGYAFYYKARTPIATATWEKVDQNSSGIPISVYDMIYANGADQFFAVTNNGKLFVTASAGGYKEYEIKQGATVTGVNASDDYIIIGMSDGSFYKTANVPVTADTVWTEIPAITGATSASEPIKNIEFIDDKSFIAFGITQTYKGNTNGYKNIKDDVELPEDPTPSPTPTTKPTDEPTVTDTPTTTDEPTTTDVPVPGGYSIKFDDKTYKAIVNAPNGTYAIIFAAYDAEGKLVSVNLEQKEVSKPDTSVFPTSFTTEGAASGKVMLWNSIDGMVPLASDIIPFG